MKNFYFLWIGVCFALPAFTQTLDTGAFRGIVAGADGKPIAGVVVRLKNDTVAKATETDLAGKFSLPFLPAGQYSLTVGDARNVAIRTVVIATGQVVNCRITLSSDSAGNEFAAYTVMPSNTVNSIKLEQAIREFTVAHTVRVADADQLQLNIGWCAPIPLGVPVHSENRIDVSAATMETFGWRSIAEVLENY